MSDAIKVACPSCSAPAGTPCRLIVRGFVKNGTAGHTHPGRIKAASQKDSKAVATNGQ